MLLISLPCTLLYVMDFVSLATLEVEAHLLVIDHLLL